jgi:SAM-dependent methyltransferase
MPLTIGDKAETTVDGPFDFVFLIFNALFNLSSQAAQVSCFQNAGRCLREGGLFVVEAFVPSVGGYVDGQQVRVRGLERRSLALDALVHDPVAQRIERQTGRFGKEGPTLTPLVIRCAWPSEPDLMARLPVLGLRHGWGGWKRELFTGESKMHVSVYERAAP